MNRRDALRVLGAGAMAVSGRAADAPFRFTQLDHIETNAPDSAGTAAFYARLFGGPVWKNNKTQRRYVRLGPCYIAIENARKPYGVDHFSAGIADYHIGEIHSFLDRHHIAYRDYPSGKDLNVTDPDGIHVQLSADNTWGPLAANTAAVEPGTFDGEPMFRASAIEEILLNVTDPEKSAPFYETIFGPAVGRTGRDGLWFPVGRSIIGLMGASKPGVSRFCVNATKYDGGYVEETEFHDPDGLRIQVKTTG